MLFSVYAAVIVFAVPPVACADVLGSSMIAAGLSSASEFSAAKVELFNVSVPTPRPDEVLIHVKGSSVNHLDVLWKIFGSSFVWNSAEALWSLLGQFPKILGMDVAGTVVGVGSNVKHLKPGDDVWTFNAAAAVWDGKSLGGLAGHGWAPYVAIPEADVAIKPKSISFIEAGALPLVAETALAALKAAGAPWPNGGTVLILGATGGVGHVAVQLAKAMGATSVVTTASAANKDFVFGLGATRLIDYHTENWWNSSVIPDASIDAVIDTVLQPDSGDRAYAKLRDHGKYVTLCTGIPSCGAPMPSLLNRLNRPSLSASALRCVAGSCASVANLDQLRSFVDSGKLRGHVDATVPLTQIQHAIDLVQSHHIIGKVALQIDDSQAVTIV